MNAVAGWVEICQHAPRERFAIPGGPIGSFSEDAD